MSDGEDETRVHARVQTPSGRPAGEQRPAAGLICYPDRGSQYAAQAYRKQRISMGAKPAMSRTACCYDNVPMESFFHTLKIELVHQRR